MGQCIAIPCGTLLLLMGLVSLYTAAFNRQALVEGSPKASLAMTTGIAVVMGSLIAVVGLIAVSRGVGF
ncbi:hypothetical protein QUF58_05500 [Anaerolineales bacterium HSG24]|nr:hypothetical protein [Anaerolineales bacterium HSG24]